LDKSWVLKPLCMTPNCCQPNHFRMAIRLAKGRFEGEPLPTVTSQPLPPPALGEMTLDEVIDSILEIDARGMDPAALAARFDEPIDKIQAALAQMALEGL